jgi:hypothetical protein
LVLRWSATDAIPKSSAANIAATTAISEFKDPSGGADRC